MTTFQTRLAAIFAVAMLSTAAKADGMVTAANGMTLYTFDSDTGGVSACYDGCAGSWPPYTGVQGEAMGDAWTLVARTDGTLQWAYDGKPTYFYAGDAAAGDMTGDGAGGVWHVIAQ
jgi:predicted lipoprotein with Yx(FWY)xxD motif